MGKMIKSASIFIRAIPSIILFELLYKLIITAIALPGFAYLIDEAVEISGLGYITSANLLKFLMHPTSVAIILLILILCSILSLVEISAIIGGLALLYSKKKIRVSVMLKCGFRNIKKLFRKFNFILVLYVMLILPLTQFTLTSGIFASVGIPSIKTLYDIGNYKSIIISAIIMFLVIILLIERIYCLHFFTLTDMGYTESVRKSKSITKNKRVKTSVSIILWTLFITAVFLIAFSIISFIITFAIKGFSEPEKAFFTSFQIIKKIVRILMVISSVLFTPMLFAYITSCFMSEIDDDTKIALPQPIEKVNPIKIRIAVFSAFALSLVLNYSFIKDISAENLMLNASFLNTTKITAHRGFSAKAPENTLSAFQEALDIGADFIELDVQLSADQKLVVFHDKNLKRITGLDELVQNLTYDELLELDYGEWFGEEFTDTKIATLDEVLENFGNKINLNIEVKKTDDENITAELTAKLIEEYNCEDTCYVTSFSYNALKIVKKINPDIKTGLIANLMTYGGYSTLDDIDALSLNKKFVSQNLVNNIHLNGKRVFVWTVNDKSDMQKFMNMGVDNIITDNPDIAITTSASQGLYGYVISFLSRIFNY